MMSYVLIVDDDEDARNILSKIVSELDINTETAADGAEALERINIERPDLILLDLMMPGMDGFQVTSKMMLNRDTRNIPIIVVSAFSVGQEDMLRLPGVSKVIRKATMRIPDMQALIAEMLGHSSAAATQIQ